MRYYSSSRCKRNSFTSIGDGQLADNVTEMKVHRAFCDSKLQTDVGASKAMGCHIKTLDLALT
jgi:hypothetical protein